jgi:hypothetical protein
VRFFGGWKLDGNDIHASDSAGIGCAKSVPMGGNLRKPKGSKAPNFMIQASQERAYTSPIWYSPE